MVRFTLRLSIWLCYSNVTYWFALRWYGKMGLFDRESGYESDNEHLISRLTRLSLRGGSRYVFISHCIAVAYRTCFIEEFDDFKAKYGF